VHDSDSEEQENAFNFSHVCVFARHNFLEIIFPFFSKESQVTICHRVHQKLTVKKILNLTFLKYFLLVKTQPPKLPVEIETVDDDSDTDWIPSSK
jgi:hypothetical protein